MTIWKEWESWTFEYFDLDTDASNFPGGEAFIDLWNKKRGDRQLPSWSDYDWDDFTPWWGSVVVTDVMWEPYDFQYRLYGSKVVEQFEVDVTGKKASELFGGEYDQSVAIEFYEMIGNKPYISRCSGTIHWQNRDSRKVTFLDLMLSDTGERVNNGVSIMF
ncbi:MAG: PAS domain-containing protein [Rhodospirillales bacterium]|jgi:hypothetical protein|nr:PAS domain-containing protein [Rhodospirillales bacterium]